ncbi:hypothetical protein [Streptomyces djakartensis]
MNARFINRRGFLNSAAGLTAALTQGVTPLDARAAPAPTRRQRY